MTFSPGDSVKVLLRKYIRCPKHGIVLFKEAGTPSITNIYNVGFSDGSILRINGDFLKRKKGEPILPSMQLRLLLNYIRIGTTDAIKGKLKELEDLSDPIASRLGLIRNLTSVSKRIQSDTVNVTVGYQLNKGGGFSEPLKDGAPIMTWHITKVCNSDD